MIAKIELTQNGGWVAILASGTKAELFEIEHEIQRNAWMWHRQTQGGIDDFTGGAWLITGKIDKSGGDYGIANLVHYLKLLGEVEINA